MPAASTTKPELGRVWWGMLGAGSCRDFLGFSPALLLSCCVTSDRPLKLPVLQIPNLPKEKSCLAALTEMAKSNSSAETLGKMREGEQGHQRE